MRSGYLEPALPVADLRGSCPALSGKGSGLSGAAFCSPSTGWKSGLNEAVGRTGRAVRARQGSHPLIRLQYFQHPIAGRGKKAKSGYFGFDGSLYEICSRFLLFRPEFQPTDTVGRCFFCASLVVYSLGQQLTAAKIFPTASKVTLSPSPRRRFITSQNAEMLDSQMISPLFHTDGH